MQEAEIASRLAAVRSEIAASAAAAGRRPEEIELVAVSKTHPADAVEAAIAAGQRVFGENRVQEAAEKYPGLKARHEGLRLHLIGPLQTNKVRAASELFDVIQTVDRARLAEALAAERDKRGRCPDLLVQVNTGEEAQKAGVPPADADALIALCRDRLRLPVQGLMCIPPAAEEPSPHFALLREIARRNGLRELSMGMSGDFAVAVRLGATLVRVGTAIFGERPLSAAPR
jgi:pyridoxal phosphate enzyme (YggS family)